MKRDCRSNLIKRIWKSLSPNNTPVIPIKLTDPRKSKKVGVIVHNLADLKEKAHFRLGFPHSVSPESLRIFLEDGTEIEDEDYLLTLNNQVVIVAPPDYSFASSSLEDVMTKYKSAVCDLRKFEAQEIINFLERNRDEVLRSSMNYVACLSKSKSHLSLKSEHPEWFQGLNTTMNSKESYLRSCAQGRIKSYLKDAKARLDSKMQKDAIIVYFAKALKQNDYFAHYFDRKATESLRLCCSAGVFNCQGRYDSDICTHHHTINPYDNSESRLLFSTWNLDHVIERVVILSNLNKKLDKPDSQIDEEKYFGLLFTRKNLKFVHKSCHVISPHVNAPSLT